MTEPRAEQDMTELNQDDAPLWARLDLGQGHDFDGDFEIQREVLQDLAEIRKIIFLHTESVPTLLPVD